MSVGVGALAPVPHARRVSSRHARAGADPPGPPKFNVEERNTAGARNTARARTTSTLNLGGPGGGRACPYPRLNFGGRRGRPPLLCHFLTGATPARCNTIEVRRSSRRAPHVHHWALAATSRGKALPSHRGTPPPLCVPSRRNRTRAPKKVVEEGRVGPIVISITPGPAPVTAHERKSSDPPPTTAAISHPIRFTRLLLFCALQLSFRVHTRIASRNRQPEIGN